MKSQALSTYLVEKVILHHVSTLFSLTFHPTGLPGQWGHLSRVLSEAVFPAR